MTTKQVQCLLAYLGYDTGGIDGVSGPKTAQAVRDFQRDYGGLAVDGDPGAATQKALKGAVAYGFQRKNSNTQSSTSSQSSSSSEKANNSDVARDNTVPTKIGDIDWAKDSPYFIRAEFRCPCGKWCNGYPVEPTRTLVLEVNRVRVALGQPMTIIPLGGDPHAGGSGVRCKTYNATFSNSSSNSYHMAGKAVDFSCQGVSNARIEAVLSAEKAAGRIMMWYKITQKTHASYHFQVA